ncbi:MAG: hypothetical protein KC417_05550, partial [Myxococcales bacterium]|nr:hypothetical protein [Myxococcales bacterium]
KLERVGAPTRARVRGYRADFPGARDDVTTGAPLGAEGLVPAPTSSADPRLFTFDASVTAPRDTFLVRAGRGGVLVASRELGIAFLRQGEAATYFRAESAVPQQTLGFATDRGGDTFVLGRDGAVVRMHGESTQPVPSPNGRRIEAIATGPRGAYAVTVAGEGDTRVALFVWEQTSWTPVLERELDAGALSAISALVVEASGDAWVAIRVPSSAGDRPRGVVWLPASRDATVSFHANVEPVPGAESKPAPDDLARPVIGEPGFVWWSSLSGAVRIGAAQVVPFGEARGVPGEIVTDVAFAPPGRVWISAAEGVGYYEGQSMRFDAPAWVNAEKPTSLALDASGRLFAGTTKGVLVRVRDAWLRGGGILNGENVRDLAVDGDDRLWVATDHTLIRLTPRR